VGNRQTVTYPNGTVTSYSYDTLNRLTDISTKDSTNSVIDSFHYDLYPTGHRHVITEANGRRADYVYDELYRLKQALKGSPLSQALKGSEPFKRSPISVTLLKTHGGGNPMHRKPRFL